MNILKHIQLLVLVPACLMGMEKPYDKQMIGENQPCNIDDFFYKLFVSEMSGKPQKLSSLGLSIGTYQHNAYLNDVSPQAMLLDLEAKKANLQRLQQYSFDTLLPEQKISYKIFLWGLDHAVSGEKFLFHEYYICHLFGILSDLTMVFTQFHPLTTPEHVDLYIARLGCIAEQLQQSIALLEHQKKIGVVPPAFTLSKVIKMIKTLLTSSIEENIFYSHLAMCIKKIETPNKEQLLAKAADVIKISVYPAYQALQHYLEKMLSNTTADNGVWALPNGDEYYAYKLKYHTTTDLSADQIHELGLQEVKKVQKEIDKILKEENVSLQDLLQNPQFYYPETEEGCKQCLAGYQAILDRSRKELSDLFDCKPKSPVQIQAVPKDSQEDAPSSPYYEVASIDGSRPGVFFVNLGYMRETPKFMMEMVAVHEAEPGHHFQLSLQQESNIPVLRKLVGYTAYIEGWALYVERLAYEQGFFSSRFAQLGYWLSDLLRAARLVIDTGIHKKQWTREQAVEYMVKNTGYPKGTVVSEVDRYFVYPGQACSYKIGQLKILELRQRAKDVLGEKFDIREFHNIVLKLGAAPLAILEEVVDQYIQDKTKN